MSRLRIIKATGATAVLAAVLASVACSSQTADDKSVVVCVGTSTLTINDIKKATPAGLTEADSIAFVDAYVNTWISDQLITEVAVKHLKTTADIEKQVEDYRRQLIMWEYRNTVVASDTALAVKDEDMRKYYDDHASSLTLTEPMVRGIYIKIESSAPALNEVRKLYKSQKQTDIDRLEKVELRGAIHYDYFRDQWIPWHQINTKIPRDISPRDLHVGYSLDFESDGFVYLLSVSDILPEGATMPYEAAEPVIRETLEAIRRNELDAKLRARLREEAVANGSLIDYRQ